MKKIVDKQIVWTFLPKRKRDSHKGTYGKAAIVAGSLDYTGAAYLAAAACLRSGAGYTALFIPKGILPYYILKAPEALLRVICDGDKYAFDSAKLQELLCYDSVAYGMGMGVSEAVCRGAEWLLRHYEGRLILDADGLNSLAEYRKGGYESLFLHKKCDVLLTPHCKEFSRLTGLSTADVIKDGENVARSWAQKYKTSVLLKNYESIITDGECVFINRSGNSGQAKGGSGDVLSGVLAGLSAMGAKSIEAGVCGAFLTGLAADFAAKDIGEYSLTASDLISYLGRAFLSVTEDTHENRGE